MVLGLINKLDTIIVLAAGKSQYPLILEGKKLGFYIVCVDRNPESIGFQICDYYILKSTFEPAPIIKELLLIESKCNFLGVLNRSSGPPVITAARISEYFRIPNVPSESANVVTNKHLLKQFCRVHNIDSPAFYNRETSDIANDISLNFPVVVKPSLSLIGKKGISLVMNKNELKRSIEYAHRYTINGQIVIEEYIQGIDVTLVSFVIDRKLYPICLLQELNKINEDNSTTGLGFKTLDLNLNALLYEKILQYSSNLVTVFNVSRSSFITCFRMNKNGELKLIEIHLDLGGDRLIEDFYPSALNVDFKNIAINMCIGRNTDSIKNVEVKPTAIVFKNNNKHINERSAAIISASSFDELNDLEL